METKVQIKNTGATFTPKELSLFLAEKIEYYAHTQSEFNRVLDPACGEGELLRAMSEVLDKNSKKYYLTGYDTNLKYLSIAKTNLLSLGLGETQLIEADFLQTVDITSSSKQRVLFDVPKTSQVNNSFDIVIANPPYVRTQILGSERAQSLAQKFNLKGRVDLYYPFIIAMTESLKENGILGVIISNRFLSTKSGESVRKFLSENYEILELIDLGDTKLFDVAVLPAIFIGRKKQMKGHSSASFFKIYEVQSEYKEAIIPATSIYDILKSKQSGHFSVNDKIFKKTSGILKSEIGSKDYWTLLSNEESTWLSKIEKSSKNKIVDFFKVRVGIKSTADKVFISNNWDKLDLIKPEDELLRELISQENIERWHITNDVKLKVLYPHISTKGEKKTIDIEKYPRAKKYFLLHEERLKSRKYLIDAGREWFELWVSHNPEHWVLPKLVFPDISSKPRFYFDNEGKIVNGNCYWIVATKEEDIEKLLLIQGVANSKLMTKYHDLAFNNKLYSGRRRYFSQYVEKYPLPDFNSDTSKEIIRIVKKLNNSNDPESTLMLENQLEIKVANAFGVAPIFNQD